MKHKTSAIFAVITGFASICITGLCIHLSSPKLEIPTDSSNRNQMDIHEIKTILSYKCKAPVQISNFAHTNKAGHRVLIDAEALYRHYHAGGWSEYLFFFMTRDLNVMTDDSSSISFTSGPHIPNTNPWQDGYSQCREQLRHAVRIYDADNVKQAVRNIRKDLEASLLED